MAKLSKAEQDRLRRQKRRAGPMDPRAKYVAMGIFAIVGIAITVAVVDDGGDADTRAANFAAFGLKDDPYLGDPDAPLVVVGFESPQCSSCQAFHNQALPGLNETWFSTGKAVMYYVQFQWGQQGGTEFQGGVAQECAFKHGGLEAFWDYTDTIYSRGSVYGAFNHEAQLRQLADARGFDADAVAECFRDQDTSKAVSSDMRVARDMDLRGTPHFFVFGDEGKAVEVSWTALDEELTARS